MRRQLRKLHRNILKVLAILIVKRYQPKVIAITGSVGKSSAKEAVWKVLHTKFKVRASIKNYNNEIGLPLTIIGANSAGSSVFAWLRIFLKGIGMLVIKDRNYPEILILEMGIDRIGDMSYLVSIVKPHIAIITAVSHSHLEYFGSVNNIKKEKQVLVESLKKNGLAVLNFDSEPVKEMARVSQAPVLSYSIKDETADFRTQDVVYNFTLGDYDLSGITFKVQHEGSVVPVSMKNVISEPSIYAVLAAFAVASSLELNVLEVASSLHDFSLPPGRMNMLPGVKHSFIIDDTYNSSPEAVMSALDILAKMNIGKESSKYAVLGEMLEIGAYTEEGHRRIGEKVAKEKINYLIAVGERARDIMRGAAEAGFNEDYMFYFTKSEDVGPFLQNRIKAGDLLLVKGSQGVRMERVVKELMAEPDKAKDLLVRQDDAWTRI